MVVNIIKNILKGIAVLFISLLIFLAILGGYLAGSMIKVAEEAPAPDTSLLMSGLKENSQIVDSNGNLIEQIETEEFREIVPYDQIPANLINAFVSAEDKRFFEHDGVDIFGILSTLDDFLRSGDMRGASTITMQLVRDVYLNKDVNWTRKIQEIYLSLRIEDELVKQVGKQEAKETILESYLNRVFFGQNAYGVQAASEIYFSKDVGDLNLPEAATIAGIVQAPSAYALYSTYRPSQVTEDMRVLGETTINGERYIAIYNEPGYERAEYVLYQMLRNGYITEQEYNDAMATDVSNSINPPAKRAKNLSTYITDVVREDTLFILMDTLNLTRAEALQRLNYGGLTITATIDIDLQRRLEDRLSSIEDVLYGDYENLGTPRNLLLSYDSYGNITNQNGELQYYMKDNLLTADNKVIIPSSQYYFDADGSLHIIQGRLNGYDGYLDVTDYYTVDENGILRTHRIGTIPLNQDSLYINEAGEIVLTASFLNSGSNFYETIEGDALAINPEYYNIDEIGVMQPQVATTIIENSTGEIKAIVGGRESDERHFLNRASSYPRQPGSTMKPLAVYAAVLGQGNNLGSAQDDTPFRLLDGVYDDYGNEMPWPRNVDGRFRGITSVMEALRLSLNTVTVKWLDQIGLDVSKEYLARFGIINRQHPERDYFVQANENPNHNDENLAMSLGAMTDGQTTLSMASAYQAIGNNGQHIEATSVAKIVDNDGNVLYENPHRAEEVLPPEVNYQLILALDNVVRNGFSNWYLDFEGRSQFVGKTGTTDYNMDFWFVGTSPYYTTAVWVGSDNAFLYLEGNSGVAARVYQAISDIVHEGTEPKQFERPEGLYEVEVCMLSGKLATDLCRQDPRDTVETILVSKQTEPTETCAVHVLADIDTRNNLLASSTTPRWAMARKVFTRRPKLYNPNDFNGIIPEDWEYEVPTIYSNLGYEPDPSLVPPEESDSSEIEGARTEVEILEDGTRVTTVYGPDGEVLSRTEEPPESLEVPPEESSIPGDEIPVEPNPTE